MAAGYKLFAFWLARGSARIGADSGNRIAVITAFNVPVASITDFN